MTTALASAASADRVDAFLLERESEIAQLTRVFGQARAGRGAVVLLDGPPGIGKSHLLRACRTLAERGDMEVLAASGRELGSEVGYGVARQLFEARMVRARGDEREALLTGGAFLAAPLLADGPRHPLPEPQASSLLHGLRWLTANLAERRPLVILIDDAHWADEPSLRFVLDLAQHVRELPVAVVLATRSAMRSAAETLSQIADQPATESVRLGPLTEAGVTAWLRATHFPGADERFCEACLEATGGNPFLLRELAVELTAAGVEPQPTAAEREREYGPDAIARAILLRVRRRAEAIAGEGQATDRPNDVVNLIEDPRQRASTALEIGRTLFAQGKHSAAADALRNGAAEVRDVDGELHLQLRTAQGLVSRMGGLAPAGAPGLPKGEPRAGETSTGRVLLAHMALEKALRGEPREEVVRLAHSALGRGALVDDETSDGLGWCFAAAALTIAEDLQGAELALATAVEDARSRGSVLGFATACYFRAWTILCRGRVADAAADAHNALAAGRYGWRLGLPGAHAILANAFMERGEHDAASHELELGAAEASTSSETPLPFFVASRAAFLLRDGQHRAALDLYQECAERLAIAGADNPACIPWRSGAALAYSQLGERGEALRLVEEELELSRRFGAPGAIGRTLLAYGSLMGGEGLELLGEAVDVLRESQAALDRARAFVAYGAALRSAGKAREAREPLREGLDLAGRCGSRTLVDQARAEALAVGTRPRRTALRGVEALTPRELEVADLAGQGMSNREIAEALFVTLKTVEWHLRHIYEKLEISARRELRAMLAGHADPV
jgi:DNA-binding CsgD family transcriptional regulator